MLVYYLYVRQDGDTYTFSERFKEGYETRNLTTENVRKLPLKLLKTFATFCEDKMQNSTRPTIRKYEEIYEFIQYEIKRRLENGICE